MAIEFFASRLSGSEFGPSVLVESKVKILKDLTVARDRDGKWRMLAGFQQQDIVFYCPRDSVPLQEFASEFTRIDKYDKKQTKPVVIPLAVCELKLGKNLVTHAIITYSSISSQLKSIFPHCAYYFVMYSNAERGLQPETVVRHTKGFDRVFLNWRDDSTREKLWQEIEGHLAYLRDRGVVS